MREKLSEYGTSFFENIVMGKALATREWPKFGQNEKRDLTHPALVPFSGGITLI